MEKALKLSKIDIVPVYSKESKSNCECPMRRQWVGAYDDFMVSHLIGVDESSLALYVGVGRCWSRGFYRAEP